MRIKVRIYARERQREVRITNGEKVWGESETTHDTNNDSFLTGRVDGKVGHDISKTRPTLMRFYATTCPDLPCKSTNCENSHHEKTFLGIVSTFTCSENFQLKKGGQEFVN